MTLISMTIVPLAYAKPGPSTAQYMEITHMTMRFDGPDAYVSINYNLDLFSNIYVFMLGSRNLEKTFELVFSDFESLEVLEIGRNHASLKLMNVSRETDDYYLHDSRELGTTIDTLTIVYPGGSDRVTRNVNSTPNIFYVKN
ncbi:hypothetical protein [Methanosalsum zhilinae]|nr:hypothetical protein [Methanosalsum zhilinae]